MQDKSLQTSLQIDLVKDFQGSLEQIYLTLERNTSSQQLSKGKTFMWLAALILTALAALFKDVNILPKPTIILGALSGVLATIAIIMCIYNILKYEDIWTWKNGPTFMERYAKIQNITAETDLKLRKEILDRYTYFIDSYLKELISPRGKILFYVGIILILSIIFGIIAFIIFVIKGGQL